jgi:hypothetical protein
MVGHTGSRGRAAKVAGRGIGMASSPRASACKSNAASPPQRRWGTVPRLALGHRGEDGTGVRHGPRPGMPQPEDGTQKGEPDGADDSTAQSIGHEVAVACTLEQSPVVPNGMGGCRSQPGTQVTWGQGRDQNGPGERARQIAPQ